MNAAWGTKNGLARADIIAAWRARSTEDRAATLDDLHLVWAKADGEMRSFGKGQAPQDEGYAEAASRLHEACAELISMRTRAAYARSEEHTSELQSLMRISYAVFCLKNKKNKCRNHARTVLHI